MNKFRTGEKRERVAARKKEGAGWGATGIGKRIGEETSGSVMSEAMRERSS